MPLDVRVATSMAEAAGILTADQRTKLLAGGTLVMRDVNEGRLLDGTLLRITDPAFRQMNTSSARIELGAGVTMAMVLNNRDLAFLHAAARSVGGPAIRQMATIGGNLFAPGSLRRFLRCAAGARCAGDGAVGLRLRARHGAR